jgi:hypothetical protein
MKKNVTLADLERENKELRSQLVELDELPSKRKLTRKSVSDLRGVQNIATSISAGVSSIPGSREDRYYLDLYFLQIERERLVKEIASIKRRRLRLGSKVSCLDKDIAAKEKKAFQAMTIPSARSPRNVRAKKQETPKRAENKKEEWNKVTLEY